SRPRPHDRGPAARLRQPQVPRTGPHVGGRPGRAPGGPDPRHRGACLRLLRPRRLRPVLPGHQVHPAAEGRPDPLGDVAAGRAAQLVVPAGRGRRADRGRARRAGLGPAVARADRGADDVPRDGGADGTAARPARPADGAGPVAGAAGRGPVRPDARRDAARPLSVHRPVRARLLRLPGDLRGRAHPARRGAEGYARRLKTAMIGPRDIAEKTYPPVLGAHPGIDLHLCTRDRDRLRRLGDAYRVGPRFTAVDEVVKAGVEVAFVHAATPAHPEIVETLLSAGVHVYVDKPLADNLPY